MTKDYFVFRVLRDEKFTEEELRALCGTLGFDADWIFANPGNIARMTQDLQEAVRKWGEIDRLKQGIKRMRPGLELD